MKNAINFETVKTNYNVNTNTVSAKKQEESRPQISESYSTNASVAIKNTMLATINVNKPQAETANKELRIYDGRLNNAQGKMVNDKRHYEAGEFVNTNTTIIRSEDSCETYLDTNVKAGELVVLGDDGYKMSTGMDGVTNRFQAEAKQDPDHIKVSDCIVKSGVRFNEVEEKYGDYAIMDENGVVNFYDKDDNNIGTMQAKIKE
ncbi:MAG: hypothetical protein K6C94_06355 [Candidatus Gastranaerophilales bacterium]|nr:hypothetical protein [Candidatus Gastranaerophilales bacterium]